MKTLFLITARGGSKGIPKKNIKLLNGKPLIQYSIDIARKFTDDSNICLSTDSKEIIEVAKTLGLDVPFIRPSELSTDSATSYAVIMHALEYFQSQGKVYDRVVLLQPTSPLRKEIHVRESLELFDEDTELVVGVKVEIDPSYLFLEEGANGFLKKKFHFNYTRRQDVPVVYLINGAIYIYSVEALKKYPSGQFIKMKKYVMDATSSIDIDTPIDWEVASLFMAKQVEL
jgi:CMP-N,N'-diacetyllegionaminic acid synthase